ncbi:hypothetical protein C3L33_13645, partial [Rhododendron williamsianum]
MLFSMSRCIGSHTTRFQSQKMRISRYDRRNYLSWQGPQAQLVVTDPESVKEIMNNKDGSYHKARPDQFLKKLLGDGIVVTEGEKWTKLRKIANHAFYAENLKFLKSRDDLESDKLQQAIQELIIAMINKREEKMKRGEENNYGSDFLGSLLKANHDPDEKNRVSVDEMVDECITFYLAGQETTNAILAWNLLLLAIHTDWQEKARKEVFELFGQQNPNAEGIAR